MKFYILNFENYQFIYFFQPFLMINEKKMYIILLSEKKTINKFINFLNLEMF